MLHNVATLVDAAIGQSAAATPPDAEKLQVCPVVRKLFMLLHGSYGNLFLSKFSTGEKDAQGRDKGIRAAMKVWESKLSRFPAEVIETAAGRLTAEHDEFPPNLPQFEKLCEAAVPRKTYAEEAGLPRLPAPVPAPAAAVSFDLRNDGKDWARRLLARHDAGEVLRPIQLRFACEALGMTGAAA
jgi:hypothetical protein